MDSMWPPRQLTGKPHTLSTTHRNANTGVRLKDKLNFENFSARSLRNEVGELECLAIAENLLLKRSLIP